MLPAQIEIRIDQKQVQEYIKGQLDQQIHERLLMIDIKKLAEITTMSPRFLEVEILSDPRMKLIQRQKARKRWWMYKPALEVIKEITSEW